MSEMLTAKEIQELLHVDRSTIYRMAEQGRIPAIKVGRQWRFPKDRIDLWLQSQASKGGVPESTLISRQLSQLLPMECVQMVQDVFADVLGVMIVVTDMAGHPMTGVSNASGLVKVVMSVPQAMDACCRTWGEMAAAVHLGPRYEVGPFGLLFVRGLIRVDSELVGMVLVGGIAPDDWPPSSGVLADVAAKVGISQDVLSAHLSEVHHKGYEERQKVLSFVQPIADVIAHIIDERNALMNKLEAIAQLTK
jgi:excisionase family DNA binding protein